MSTAAVVAFVVLAAIVAWALWQTPSQTPVPAPTEPERPKEDPPHPKLAAMRALTKKPCTYALGKGGRNPDADTPAVKSGDKWLCDCTGLNAWAFGFDRYLRKRPDFAGDWWETTMLWKTTRMPNGLVRPVPVGSVRVGDGVVRPDADGHEGHAAWVSEVQNGVATKIIHCSPTNGATTAIKETGLAAFQGRPNVVFFRLREAAAAEAVA